MNFIMSPRELKAVMVLGEELHFGRAAERLGIAQPQLSHLMQRVERAASFALFTRRPRVRLTPGGAVLLEGVRRAFHQLESTLADARSVASGKSGSVRLGFSDAAMMTEIPNLLRAFKSAHPSVELKLTEGHSQSLFEQLKRGDLDVIVTRQRVDDVGVTSVEAVQDRFVLAVPESHWAGSELSVPLASLRDEGFVLFNRNAAPDYFDLILAGCRSAGLEPRIAQVVDTRNATLALVSAGFGLAIVTTASERNGFEGVRFCPIEDELPQVSFWLSYYASRLAPAAQFLASSLQGGND